MRGTVEKNSKIMLYQFFTRERLPFVFGLGGRKNNPTRKQGMRRIAASFSQKRRAYESLDQPHKFTLPRH
jgi:hypothetical protein